VTEKTEPPKELAQYLGVELRTPREIPGLPKAALDQLLVRDPSGWSAVTVNNGGKPLVIYNPRGSTGRQATPRASSRISS